MTTIIISRVTIYFWNINMIETNNYRYSINLNFLHEYFTQWILVSELFRLPSSIPNALSSWDDKLKKWYDERNKREKWRKNNL